MFELVVDAVPELAGIDPHNKLIGRMPGDIVRGDEVIRR